MAKQKRKQPLIVSQSEVRFSAMEKIDETSGSTVNYGGTTVGEAEVTNEG